LYPAKENKSSYYNLNFVSVREKQKSKKTKEEGRRDSCDFEVVRVYEYE
jgi:hypothetical protein